MELGVPIVPSSYIPKTMDKLNDDEKLELFHHFKTGIENRDIGMEFRILNRITLHLDHGENFVRYDLSKMKLLDRKHNILPYKHNRVHLKL